MQKRRLLSLFLLFALLAPWLNAKEEPAITLRWPPETPAISLTFGRFRLLYSQGKDNTYTSDVTVSNLTDKSFVRLDFRVYLMDKDKVRIGDGFLSVTDIGPRQEVKVPFQCMSVGVPTTISLSAKKDMLAAPVAKTVSLKIVSVPPGAKLKVDGQELGMTPFLARLTVGSHDLELNKEGYAVGRTSVEIAPDELPGGSVTIELGGLSRDTVELRDGTVLLGDVLSMSMTSVIMRVDGKDQTYARNLVKKIILVEREIVTQPAVIQPAPQPK
jgi:hypothetical protein